MINFYPVRCGHSSYSEYVELFSQCFPGVKKYSYAYLDWLYRCNPDGQVLGYDARDGERLIAHYACIPMKAVVGDREVSALLSLNTATHPDYQGKGLFTQLAERTYTAGIEQGYDCVFGVANFNSTPGFIRKLKFNLVTQLRAMVGIGSLGIDFNSLDSLQFRRSWTSEALSWRCASPENPVVCQVRGNHIALLTPALLGGACNAIAEIECSPLTQNADLEIAGDLVSPLRLFIGLIPQSSKRMAMYKDIPNKLKPSPLNLIYRSLSGRITSIDPDKIFFNYLDFDAY